MSALRGAKLSMQGSSPRAGMEKPKSNHPSRHSRSWDGRKVLRREDGGDKSFPSAVRAELCWESASCELLQRPELVSALGALPPTCCWHSLVSLLQRGRRQTVHCKTSIVRMEKQQPPPRGLAWIKKK